MFFVQFLGVVSFAGVVKAGVDLAQCEGRSGFWVSPSLCMGPDATTTPTKCTIAQFLCSPDYYECHELVATDTGDFSKDSIQSYLTNFMVMAALARDYEIEMESEYDRDQLHSSLTSFMLLASLTRDLELQKELDHGMCDSPLPWDEAICVDNQIQSMLKSFILLATLTRNLEVQKEFNQANGMITGESDDAGTFKQVHRTEPVLEPYNFDPDHTPVMATMTKNDESTATYNNNNWDGKNNNSNNKSHFGLPREKVQKFIKSMKSFPAHSWRKLPEKSYF